MKVSSDVVVIPMGAYKPSAGHYGIFSRRLHWHHCRDVFHNELKFRFWHMDFLFAHHKGKRENIAEFIEKIEDQLNLVDRTKFVRTNVPTIMFIRPSVFWYRQSMKFSLFTLLLRASQHYTSDVDEAILEDKYLSNTYRAVKMFLAGRTRYTGWSHHGWGDVFSSVECCYKMKCGHKDRRCRHKLEAWLVPEWQIPPIDMIVNGVKWIKRLVSK